MDKPNKLPANFAIRRTARWNKAAQGVLTQPPAVGKNGTEMGKPCSEAKDVVVMSVLPGKGEGDCVKTPDVPDTTGRESIGDKEDGKVDDTKNGQNTTKKPKKKKPKKKTVSTDSSKVAGTTAIEKDQEPRPLFGNPREVFPSRGRVMHRQSDTQSGKSLDNHGEKLLQQSGNGSSHPGTVEFAPNSEQRRHFSGDSRYMRGNYRRNYDDQRRSNFSRSGNADGSSESGTMFNSEMSSSRGSRVFVSQARQNSGNHRGLASNRPGYEKRDNASIESGKVTPDDKQKQPQQFHKQQEFRNHNQNDYQRDTAATVACSKVKADASDDNPQTLQRFQIQPELQNQNDQHILTSSGTDRKNASDNQSQYQGNQLNYRRMPYNPRPGYGNQRDQPNNRRNPDYQRQNYGNQRDSRDDGRNPDFQRHNYGNQRDQMYNTRIFNDRRQNYQHHRDSVMQKIDMRDNHQQNYKSQREPMHHRRFPDNQPQNYGNQRDQLDNRGVSDNRRHNYGNHRDTWIQRGREYPSQHGPGSFDRHNHYDSKREWDNRRSMGSNNQWSGTMKGGQQERIYNYQWPGAFSDKRDTDPTEKDLEYIKRWLDGHPKSDTKQPEKQVVEEEEEDDWDAPKKLDDSLTQISSVELQVKTDESNMPLGTVDSGAATANYAESANSSEPAKQNSAIEQDQSANENGMEIPSHPPSCNTTLPEKQVVNEHDCAMSPIPIMDEVPNTHYTDEIPISSDMSNVALDNEPRNVTPCTAESSIIVTSDGVDIPPAVSQATTDNTAIPAALDAPIPSALDVLVPPTSVIVRPATEVSIRPPLDVSIPPPKEVSIRPAMEVSIPPPNEVSIRPAMEVSIPPPNEVSIRPAMEVSISPHKEVSIRPAMEVSISPHKEVSIRPAMEVSIPPPNEVSIRPAMEVSISPHKEVSIRPAMEVSIPPHKEVSIRPAMEVSIPSAKDLSIRPAMEVPVLQIQPEIQNSVVEQEQTANDTRMEIPTHPPSCNTILPEKQVVNEHDVAMSPIMDEVPNTNNIDEIPISSDMNDIALDNAVGNVIPPCTGEDTIILISDGVEILPATEDGSNSQTTVNTAIPAAPEVLASPASVPDVQAPAASTSNVLTAPVPDVLADPTSTPDVLAVPASDPDGPASAPDVLVPPPSDPDIVVTPTSVLLHPAKEVSTPLAKEVTARPTMEVSIQKIQPEIHNSVVEQEQTANATKMGIPSHPPSCNTTLPDKQVVKDIDVAMSPIMDVPNTRNIDEIPISSDMIDVALDNEQGIIVIHPCTREVTIVVTSDGVEVEISPATEEVSISQTNGDAAIPVASEVPVPSASAPDVLVPPASALSQPAKELSIRPATEVSIQKIQPEIQTSSLKQEQSASETVKEIPIRRHDVANLSGPGYMDLEEIYRQVFEKDLAN
ncbi:unnamed protein product [Orchesella dallaii]|uniref:Uncharacterized protein n=1 Tax=Orchesella dallaii TaxID=48710 RepID=A0ABP1R6R7_9HEXA